MSLIDIDALDRKLLSLLQDDGRLTNQELGERAGLSASQCSRRRTKLESAGLIRGYRADLAAERLGFGILAFVQVTLATHSRDNAQRFKDLLDRTGEVQEAYSLTGDADYLIKVALSDLAELSRFVSEVLLPHESVAHVRSSVVLERLKQTSRLPLAR